MVVRIHYLKLEFIKMKKIRKTDLYILINKTFRLIEV